MSDFSGLVYGVKLYIRDGKVGTSVELTLKDKSTVKYVVTKSGDNSKPKISVTDASGTKVVESKNIESVNSGYVFNDATGAYYDGSIRTKWGKAGTVSLAFAQRNIRLAVNSPMRDFKEAMKNLFGANVLEKDIVQGVAHPCYIRNAVTNDGKIVSFDVDIPW